MRSSVHEQQVFLPGYADHELASELALLDEMLGALPGITELVLHDLLTGVTYKARGRQGLSAEQVLRCLITKMRTGDSYEKLAFRLSDSSSYRTFCRLGFTEYPRSSTLQENIKKITPAALEAINIALLGYAEEVGVEDGQKIRIDSTAVATNIHKPTDSSLLYDVVRVLDRILGAVADEFDIDVQNNTKRAKRRAFAIANARNVNERVRLYRDLLKVTVLKVAEARRAAKCIEPRALARSWIEELHRYSDLGEQVINQCRRRVLEGQHVPVEEKLFSIFELHTDLIAKRRRDPVFGHKINLSSGTSGLYLDCVIEDGNPADAARAVPMLERHVENYSRVPRQCAMDGGYASKKNLEAIKGLGVQDVCFHKKRGLQVEAMVKSRWVFRKLRNFRAGIEAGISYLKRCFGLRRCNWKGLASFKAYVWAAVLSANLVLLCRRWLM